MAFGTGGLNLSAANTHLYIWVNMLAGGLMATRANNGLSIFLSSDATLATGSNYKMWAVDGSDTYPGGWVRYVLDISKTATVNVGALDLSSVQWVGMYCDTRPNVAKFDNLVIDRIDYTTGPALGVYDTSTTDDLFGDIWTADAGTVANQYGIVRRVGGVYFLKGRIEFGDSAGINAANLTDIDKIVVYENPVYYNGSSVVSSISTSLYRLDFVGNGTGSTTVQFGKKVGSGDTASGRNGLTFVSAGPPVAVDFDDGSADSVKIYGTIFRKITGSLSWGTNTAHEFIGSSVDQSAQFDPVGGVQLRNCIFSGYTADPDGALLWNESINIKNSQFIASTDVTNDPAAVEHPSAAGSPYTYDNLTFSGNDFDVNNTSAAVDTGSITIDVDATAGTLTRSAGDFTADGFAAGMTITASGFTNGGNNFLTKTISTITGGGTIITVTDNSGLVDETGDGNERVQRNITINLTNDSDASTSKGEPVTLLSAVSLEIRVKDTANDPIENAQTAIFRVSDDAQLMNENTNPSGVAQEGYTGAFGDIYVRVRKSDSLDPPKYVPFSTTGTISGDFTLDVTLQEDTNA